MMNLNAIGVVTIGFNVLENYGFHTISDVCYFLYATPFPSPSSGAIGFPNPPSRVLKVQLNSIRSLKCVPASAKTKY
jgi:hypothetical protein